MMMMIVLLESKPCSPVSISLIFPQKNFDFIFAVIFEFFNIETNVNLLFPFLNMILIYLVNLRWV